MQNDREFASAAMFEDDSNIWWITGGQDSDLNDRFTTEIFNASDNTFAFGAPLPTALYLHNLVNVNGTHMVLLGGQDDSRRISIIQR